MDILPPPAVRAKAEAAGAHEWLRGLNDLVAGIEQDWAVTVGRVYADATEALVADGAERSQRPGGIPLQQQQPGEADAAPCLHG